jgi:hypothetical protein
MKLAFVVLRGGRSGGIFLPSGLRMGTSATCHEKTGHLKIGLWFRAGIDAHARAGERET